MNAFSESWVQELAAKARLPALSPSVLQVLLPCIDIHCKKLALQVSKFMRRSRGKELTGKREREREIDR